MVVLYAKKIQQKLLIDNQFFLCKIILKYNGFGMQEVFLWVQFLTQIMF